MEVNAINQKDKIYWRLLTTHKVESFDKALQIVEWYKARWYIEGEGQPIVEVFTATEIECLEKVNQKIQGKIITILLEPNGQHGS